MQLFWWLAGTGVLFGAVAHGIIAYLARLARRGVSGTEIIALALGPFFILALLLQFAGIASAFVLAAGRGGTTSGVLYLVGSLWISLILAEAAASLYSSRRQRPPRARSVSGGRAGSP